MCLCGKKNINYHIGIKCKCYLSFIPYQVIHFENEKNISLIQQQQLKYQFFAELLSTLEAEGFSFGTEQHLQWQKMLERLPEDISLADLKTLVCPLIASNEEEQVLVYRLYEACLERVETINATDLKDNSQKKGWLTKLKPWLILVAGLLAVLYFFYPSKKKTAVLSDKIEATYLKIAPGQTKEVCIKSNKLSGRPKMVAVEVLNQSSTESPLGRYRLDTLCLQYTAKDTTGQDALNIRLTDINGKHWFTSYLISIKDTPLDTIIRKVLQKKARPVSTLLFSSKDDPYPNDIRELELLPLNALEKFYQEHAKLIKFLLIALFTAFLTKILLARDEKRKKLVAELDKKQTVFPILGLNREALESIKSGEVFFRLLNKLRQRTPDEFYRLNLPKTIAETIKKAGMINFRYELQTRPAEYLLVIDGQSEVNHLNKLFELIYEYFKLNEVHLERFFLNKENGLCYNENHSAGIKLEELQYQFYNSKVLLLVSENQTESTFLEKLKNWKSIFKGGGGASILLPVPILAKISKEAALSEGLTIVPATIEGLNYLLEQSHETRVTSGKLIEKSKIVIQQFPVKGESIIPFLQQHFSEPMVAWIAACAIYPSLQWNLTLHLGKVLAQSEDNLLSIENLFELANLPWFLNGEMPVEVREELLTHLNEKYPALYQSLQAEVNGLFEGDTLSNRDKSGKDYDNIIGINQLLPILEEEAQTALEEGNKKAEVTKKTTVAPIISKLNRKPTILDFLIPNEWKHYLKKMGFPNLGMQDFWKDMLFIMLPLWLLFSGFVWNLPEKWDNCDGEIIKYEHNGKPLSLCISEPHHLVLLNEYYARTAVKQQKGLTVDSLSQLVKDILEKGKFDAVLTRGAIDVEALESAVVAYFGNIGTTYFNQGVQAYTTLNKADESWEAKILLKEKACYNFNRAVIFDTEDTDFKKAVNWCLKKEILLVTIKGQVFNQETQSPVSNVRITYKGQSAVTNKAGKFAFKIKQKSSLKKVGLKVSKIGFLSLQDSFLMKKDSATFTINSIYLSPEQKPIEKYIIKGTITDLTTNTIPSGIINIFTNAGLETNTDNGEFLFELEEKVIEANKITIRLEGTDYETYQQEVIFDNKKATLNIVLKPAPKDFVDLVEATESGNSVSDSMDYLLTTIMEVREAFVPFDFDVAIPKMHFIEGDTFEMGDVMGDKGSPLEQVHTVAVQGFYIGTYEVTYEEFDTYCNTKSLKKVEDNGWDRGKQPVLGVSWYQAIEYCNWLSAEHGYEPVYTIEKIKIDVEEDNQNEADTLKWEVIPNWQSNGYRLPTEAEWEFAARQKGQKVRFGNGKNQANPMEINFKGTETAQSTHEITGINREETTEVGTFEPNAEDLFDMSGNVSEWCWDWLGEELNLSEIDFKGSDEGVLRITKGGGYNLPANDVRVSARIGIAPNEGEGIGFRLCRSTN